MMNLMIFTLYAATKKVGANKRADLFKISFRINSAEDQWEELKQTTFLQLSS